MTERPNHGDYYGTPRSSAPQVAVGDTVTVEPKNPLTSTTTWGLVLAGLAWLARHAVAKGWLPDELKESAVASAVEIILFLAGLGIAAYGRWKASRPLGFAAVKQVTVK